MNSHDGSAWRDLYTAALFELDSEKIPNRIKEAENAIVSRVQQLFSVDSDDREQKLLAAALMALQALRDCTDRGKPLA